MQGRYSQLFSSYRQKSRNMDYSWKNLSRLCKSFINFSLLERHISFSVLPTDAQVLIQISISHHCPRFHSHFKHIGASFPSPALQVQHSATSLHLNKRPPLPLSHNSNAPSFPQQSFRKDVLVKGEPDAPH